MDFDEAVATHSQWKRRLREYLGKKDGSLSPVEISLDHKCALGQWIYGEGQRYSALPQYTRLKYEHARFHQAAAALVDSANGGENVDQEVAPCSSSEFSNASSAIVIALMDMKKQLEL